MQQPSEREGSPVLRELRATADALNAARKLDVQITTLRTRLESADQLLKDISYAWGARKQSDCAFDLDMRSLYGTDTDAVLAKIPLQVQPTRCAAIARALRTGPSRLGRLDARWTPILPRPGLTAELQDAAKSAANRLMLRDTARRAYHSACIRAAQYCPERIGPQASHAEIVDAVTAVRDEIREELQHAQTQLSGHDRTGARRKMQEHFGFLPVDEQQEFLQHYPECARSVALPERGRSL